MLYFLICVNVCELTKYLSVGKRKRIILSTRAIGFKNSYKQIFRMTLTSSLVIPLQLWPKVLFFFLYFIMVKQNNFIPYILVAGNQNITPKSMLKLSLCYRVSWSMCHIICNHIRGYTHTCILLATVIGATFTQIMKARCII